MYSKLKDIKRTRLLLGFAATIFISFLLIKTSTSITIPKRTKLDIPTTSTPYVKTLHRDDTFDYIKLHYSRQEDPPTKKPTVLLLTSIKPKSHPYGPDRTFDNFIQFLNSISMASPQYDFSIGILANGATHFNEIHTYIETNSSSLSTTYSSITLLQSPSLDDPTVRHKNKHPTNFEILKKKKVIAKCRNFLLTNVLKFQQYTIFIDSDILSITKPDFVDYFIKSGLDIIVPQVRAPSGNANLRATDPGTWRGLRTKPSKEELEILELDEETARGYAFMPHTEFKPGVFTLQNYIQNVFNEFIDHKDNIAYSVPLDSVGGLVLFAKSVIFKLGVTFPPTNIIGTTWDRKRGGYDGIESEGICYLAKPLGFHCWAMPNVIAEH